MRNRFIQVWNPRGKVWILVDRLKGRICGSDKFLFDGIRVRKSKLNYV